MDKTVKGATKIKVRDSKICKVHALTFALSSSQRQNRNMSSQSCLRRTAVKLESQRSFAHCSYVYETQLGP
jgi:hypothetical protein